MPEGRVAAIQETPVLSSKRVCSAAIDLAALQKD
jgi:hypothetical protein